MRPDSLQPKLQLNLKILGLNFEMHKNFNEHTHPSPRYVYNGHLNFSTSPILNESFWCIRDL